MRTESVLFNIIAGALVTAAGIYAWWADKVGEVEWIGTMALVLSGLLCAMCGFYFGFVARRIDPRPEDRHDGEISDGIGEIGFFSPGSYWPLGIALAVATIGLGTAYEYLWLVGAGFAAVIVTAAGLLFEYYTGTRRSGPL